MLFLKLGQVFLFFLKLLFIYLASGIPFLEDLKGRILGMGLMAFSSSG